jgi:ATP-dependent Clp protease adaptor protein ClpS
MSLDAVITKKNTTKQKFKEPSKYKVIVLNDNYTPMEFVIEMFIIIFNFDEAQAVKLTMQIHTEGVAIAGTYTYEIAEQKGIEATNLAREHGHPLVIKIEAV